jgi:diguanylate cyclase (GGDEF)-like protein
MRSEIGNRCFGVGSGGTILKQIELKRYQKIEEYVFITQTLFLLLSGILLVRIWKLVSFVFLNFYLQIMLAVTPLMSLFIFKHFKNEYSKETRTKIEILFNILYLFFCGVLLNFEKEAIFKYLLFMPVITASIRQGIKQGFFWAGYITIEIIAINLVQQSWLPDLDFLVAGLAWFFAFILGKMSETEKQAREELILQASVDSITGLWNHRSFYDLLEEKILLAQMKGEKLALLMIDIDYFKFYNDAYGHQRGDEVLRRIAQVIQENLKDVGLAARFGGDEFGVILPGDGDYGLSMGEDIRKAVEETCFEGDNILPGGHLTVSIGVACYPDTAESKEILIERANDALYKAKYTKSNRVEMYYSVFDEISNSLQGKDKELLSSMRTLLMVINAKDKYTYGHSERVMNYAVQIARKLALWEWEIQDLSMGALLHDIGKIELSRKVLNKPGKLNSKEWGMVCQHTIWGADMIRPISDMELADAINNSAVDTNVSIVNFTLLTVLTSSFSI